jgi:plasmid maintenance system antidote protein VapI
MGAADLFVHNLKRVMDDQSITTAELARRLKVKGPSISVVITGRERVTLDRADRIAKAVGYPLASLVGGKLG